jgi:tetratricopeptide (TPR) repeat protein
MKKAIAIVTYSRAHYFALVLPSILAQRVGDKPISEVYDIYIFQDGLWPGETSENRLGHSTIRRLLKFHAQDRVFRQTSNLGVALHFDFIEKLLFVEKQYDFVAFCEDDLILAPGYMAVLDQMGDRFADDPRVGMMSAHPGDSTASLEAQRKHSGDYAAMGHNWAFGLSRNFWLRRQPFVEQYLDLIRDTPYRNRRTSKVLKWLELAGFRDTASSQDYVKQCATTALGACRLSTFANLGLPIGRTGLHCTPHIFLELGMDRAVVVDQALQIGALTDEQFSQVSRKSGGQRETPAERVVRLAQVATKQSQPKAREKGPRDTPTVQPDSIEALSPILALVSSRLTNDPEWAVPLLDVVAVQLATPMQRRTRDGSKDRSLAICAAHNIAGRAEADVEDWIVLAHLLAAEGRLNEALRWVNLVLRHQPHVASHHRLHASVLERLDRPKEGLAAVERALGLDPANPDLISDRARIAGCYAQSIRRTRDDLATQPDAAIAAGMSLAQRAEARVEDFTALAQLLAMSQRLNEALEWSRRALAAEPDVVGHHCMHVSLLERLGRFEAALHAARQALELHPSNTALTTDYERVASAYTKYLRQRRDTSPDLLVAAAAGQQLAQRDPPVIEDCLVFAQLLVRQQRHAEALIWIDKVIARKPNVADYLVLRASSLERLGRFEEALYDALRARDLRPDDVALVQAGERIEAGFVKTLRDRRDGAKDLALAIDAGHKLAQYTAANVDDWVALAQLLAKAERLNEALGWASRALQSEPAVVGLHCLNASLLERLDRHDEAFCAIQRAVDLHPTESVLVEDRKRIESQYVRSLRERRDGSPDAGLAIEAGQRLAWRDSPIVEDWLALARLLARAGRINEALGCVDGALVAEPEAAHHHQFRANMLERLGEYRKAYRSAKRAHALDPGNSDLAQGAKRLFRKTLAHSLGLHPSLRAG